MNLNIELTDLQEKFLKLFAKNQCEGSKDNVCTHKPIHAVQTQRERITEEGYNEDKVIYYVPDWSGYYDTAEELIRAYYENEDCPITIVSFDEAYKADEFKDVNGEFQVITDDMDYLNAYGIDEKLYYKQAVEYYYEDVAYFFILDEARRYIKYQSHNLNNPRTYTKGPGYSNCGDYEHFWDLLMAMGKKLNATDVVNS